jgi:hypothetical protein
VLVLTDQGTTVTEFTLPALHGHASDNRPVAIRRIQCSAMRADGKWTIAIATSSNRVLFLRAYDDLDPCDWHGDGDLVSMQWSSDGRNLAVISTRRLTILSSDARVLLGVCVPLPASPGADQSLTAFTWAHEDRVLVIASGGRLAVGRVLYGVPSLFQLVSYKIWNLLGRHGQRVERLPLPGRERLAVRALDHHVIRVRAYMNVWDICSVESLTRINYAHWFVNRVIGDGTAQSGRFRRKRILTCSAWSTWSLPLLSL